MAVFDSPAPELAVADGEQIKWIAEWEGHADLFLLGRPGVSTTKDLAGKSVAETVAGSTTAVLTQVALQDAGVLTSAHLQPLGNVGATFVRVPVGFGRGHHRGPAEPDDPAQGRPRRQRPGELQQLDSLGRRRPGRLDLLGRLAQDRDRRHREGADGRRAVLQDQQGRLHQGHRAGDQVERGGRGGRLRVDARGHEPDHVHRAAASIEAVALKAIASTSPGAASLTGASVVDTELAQAAGN